MKRPARARCFSACPLAALLAVACFAAALGTETPPADEGHGLGHVLDLLAARRFAEAETEARRALERAERKNTPCSLELGLAADALVASLHGGGKAAAGEALELAERAVEIKEAARGPEHPQTAVSLGNLARVLREVGDYPEARRRLERARTILEGARGPEHPSTLRCLNSLAGILHDMGALEDSRRLYEDVLEARERALEPDHLDVAQSLNNLAWLLADQGRLDLALPVARRALEIREARLLPDDPRIASSLACAAWILHLSGSGAAARPLEERALVIREKALGPGHPDVAYLRENLALLDSGAADPTRTIAVHQRVLAERKSSLGPGHPLVARSRRHLARSLAAAGRLREALDEALLAEEVAREHLRAAAGAVVDREAFQLREARELPSFEASGLDLALSLLSRMPAEEAASRVWDAVIRSRAIILDEAASRLHSVRGDDPRRARLRAELAVRSARHAAIAVRGPEESPAEAHAELLRASREAMESAERALRAEGGADGTARRRREAGYHEVAASLPRGAALAAYVRQEGTGGAYGAFVIRAGNAAPELTPLGSAAEIESLAAAWLEEASRGAPREGRPSAAREAACRDAGAALRARIWDPIAPRLAGAERVFVVLDAGLHLVNLAALPSPDGPFLVETGPLLHFLSAERDLLEEDGGSPRGQGLLAMGGADFDAPLTGEAGDAPILLAEGEGLRGSGAGQVNFASFASVRFSPLPASTREVEEVAALWRGKGHDALVLTGALATEAAFKAAAPARRILHVATHGFFLGGDARPGAPGGRGIGSLTAAGRKGGASRSDARPLRLSGLTFAGANRRRGAAPGAEDGILTAEEIAALDLSRVEWAVLSACDTGAGEVRAGEGILGLRRAFQVAGAGTLVLSLWPVFDADARDFMTALHASRLSKGSDAAEAARDACLEVLRSRRERGLDTHPFHWAAFVAAGR